MERARNDADLIARVGNMERRIRFDVGYNHMEFPQDCGGGGHGVHGMTLCFLLIGPHGAVQWKVNLPNWFPGNVNIIDTVQSVGPFSAVPADSRIGDGLPTDLGHHWPKEQYEGEQRFDCDLLPEGYCYYDGSGLNAGPVLRAFLDYGPMAVWAALGRYYHELHEQAS